MKDFGKQITIILIASIIGFIIAGYKTKLENEIKYIDYNLVTTENVFNRFSLPTPQIIVKTPSKEVSTVTQVEITFQNNQEFDFGNIPIYIDFIQNNKQKIEIIGKSVVGDRGLSDGITNYKMRELKQDKSTIRVSFNILTLNRNPKNNDYPKITFLLAGEIAPDVKILTSKKSVLLRPYNIDNYESKRLIIVIVILLYILSIIAYLVFTNYQRNSKRKKYNKEFVLLIKQYIMSNQNTPIPNNGSDIRKYAKGMYFSGITDKIHEDLNLYERFIQDNITSLTNCSEEMAYELAQTIIIQEENLWLKKRAKWRNILFPISSITREDLK